MRNAIVIGVGGTGSWVLTHLKRRLLTEHRYQQLAQGTDVMNDPDYNAHHWPVISRALDIDANERPMVDGVRLAPKVEDITITAPFGMVVDDFRDSSAAGRETSFPTIATWLSPEEVGRWTILERLKDLDQAGQVRQFGRIAFFLEVINGAPNLARLGQAMAQLPHAQDVQVILTGSVAGGTGAGLMLDTLAYLQRLRGQMAGVVDFTTLGFFVLPTGFAGLQIKEDERERMHGNGFATLRELKRFLGAPDTVDLKWANNVGHALTQPALDFCYLVDGSRDQPDARQMEHFAPFEDGLPVAIADALMTHIYTATSGDLGMDYAALNAAIINGSERFASFGTYMLGYAWEPLMRSSSLRAADDVLTTVLGLSTDNGRDLAASFLTSGATGQFALGEVEGPVPPIVAYGAATSFELEQPFPTSRWVEPQVNPVAVQSVPGFRDEWDELGRVITKHQNEDVKAGASATQRAFFGETREVTEAELQTGMPVPLLPGFLTNTNRAGEEFRRALWVATTAVLNMNQRRGAPTLAVSFLTALTTTLGRFAKYVGELPAVDLQPLEERVETAEMEMNDSRSWDDAWEQSEYLDAMQEYTQARAQNEQLMAAVTLAGRLVAITSEVLDAVRSWRNTLEQLQEQAIQERNRVDQQRHRDSAVPVRRFVPLPGDAANDKLFTAAWTDQTDEGRDGLDATLDLIAFNALGLGKAPRIIMTFHGPDSPVKNIELSDLTTTTARRFVGFREKSIFEILEMNGEGAEKIAGELDGGAARLAAFNPIGQAQANQEANPVDKRYVWAAWPAGDEAYARLGTTVRDQLQSRNLSVRDLTDPLEQAASTDKIVVYTSHHLLALRSFNGVDRLVPAYKARRTTSPSPHVMPEEVAAIRLEEESEALARDGYFPRPIDELSIESVRFAPHDRLLKSLAACIAVGAIGVKRSAVQGTASWTLDTTSGDELELGTDLDLDALVLRLVSRSDQFDERNQTQAIMSRGGAAEHEDGFSDKILHIGRNGSGLQASADLETMLQLNAARVAMSLSWS